MKVYPSDSVAPAPVDHGEGVSIRWLITREQGAPNFAMRIIEVEPGGATPLHRHFEEHEVYVLEGKGLVKGEQGDMPIKHGDVVYVSPRELHQFVNAGDSALRFICVIPIKKSE